MLWVFMSLYEICAVNDFLVFFRFLFLIFFFHLRFIPRLVCLRRIDSIEKIGFIFDFFCFCKHIRNHAVRKQKKKKNRCRHQTHLKPNQQKKIEMPVCKPLIRTQLLFFIVGNNLFASRPLLW